MNISVHIQIHSIFVDYDVLRQFDGMLQLKFKWFQTFEEMFETFLSHSESNRERERKKGNKQCMHIQQISEKTSLAYWIRIHNWVEDVYGKIRWHLSSFAENPNECVLCMVAIAIILPKIAIPFIILSLK